MLQLPLAPCMQNYLELVKIIVSHGLVDLLAYRELVSHWNGQGRSFHYCQACPRLRIVDPFIAVHSFRGIFQNLDLMVWNFKLLIHMISGLVCSWEKHSSGNWRGKHNRFTVRRPWRAQEWGISQLQTYTVRHYIQTIPSQAV